MDGSDPYPIKYIPVYSLTIKCYGFAFGMPELTGNPGWLSADPNKPGDYIENGKIYSVEEVSSMVLRDLYKAGKDVERVYCFNEAKEDQFLVELRVTDHPSIDWKGEIEFDYHFVVWAVEDGGLDPAWADKPGSQPSRFNQNMIEDDMWRVSLADPQKYDSDVILFAARGEWGPWN